jgi:anti-sigma B factor antagonist
MRLKIIRKKTDNEDLHLKLTGEMTVYSAAKLKDILLNELKFCPGLTLDLADVDEADTAGFQLLLFLKREADLHDKSFRVTEMNSRLNKMFTFYKEKI